MPKDSPIFRYKRPYLYPKQAAFVDCTARYTIVDASVKTGKTTGMMIWILEQLLKGKAGQHFWWVAPIYSQAGIAFERIKIMLKASGFPQSMWKVNETAQSITIMGRIMEFRGADNPDSLYGQDVTAAVCDESSRCSERSWQALRSTLTATRGPIKIIGNVRGRKNWAYQLGQRARAGEKDMAYFKLTAWDAVEAGVLAKEEIEDAQRTLPADVFKELYLAEPSEDGGNPFGLTAIDACIEQERSTLPPVCFGVDLAKSVDWVWVIGLDEYGRECVSERWQSDWAQTQRRIAMIVGDKPAVCDATGVGDPVVENLSRECSSLQGFKFSSQSKQSLMEGLAVAIQQRQISFFDPVLVDELRAYEFEYKGSRVFYSAPPGMHDDGVCALALCNHIRQKGGNISEFDTGFTYVSAMS